MDLLPHISPLPLIHLVESDLVQAERQVSALKEGGYEVTVFSSLADFRAAYTNAPEIPTAVVTGIDLSEWDQPDTDFIARLGHDKHTNPFVIAASSRNDMTERLAAYRAGADHFLSKPVDTRQLLELLNTHRLNQTKEPYRVLVVGDNHEQLEKHASILGSADVNLKTLAQPFDLMELASEFHPEVFILDMNRQDAIGLELASALRDCSKYKYHPILFISAKIDPAEQQAAIDMDVDYLVEPVSPDYLATLVTARARRSRRKIATLSRLESTLYEQEREHLALDHHAIVSVADRTGNITYVNDKFCEISRFSRDELIGQNHRILRSGNHPPEFYENLWHTISSGNVWKGEICNRRKDGSLYWVESTITPFLDADGTPYQYVSIRTDITHVKAAEWALRQSESRLEFMLYEQKREHLALNQHAIVSVTDRTGNIIYVNDKFCEISHYSRNELLGNNHRILKSDMHSPEFYQNLWNTISSGNVWKGEICNRRKDGSLYWVESTITPFCDSNGKPYQYVSIRTDITRLKTAEFALRESEERLNFLVSSSPATIYTCTTTPPYRPTYVSANIEYLTGYTPEQFLEDSHFWASHIHPDDQQRVFDELPQVFEKGTHIHEYRFLTKDGNYQWIHDELRIVSDENGEPFEIIGYCIDITERKNAEQKSEANKERLRRGQLFANIGTWDWNIQTGELYWTERIAPLFGYPVGELETSYENFLAAIHPDDRQNVIDAVNACISHDIPYEIEHRVVWPDGTERWLLERGAVLRDVHGTPLQMLGVVQDIDDRKRAEMALADRERQLREAQTLANLGHWHANLITGELIWSEEIYRIFGLDPDNFEPSVEAFHAAVHPDDVELVRESEQRSVQTGLHDVVHRIVRPDGTVRHVHELAQMETDEDGKPIQLTGTVQDVTKQVEADAKLKETEERFVFAVEGAGDGVWDWDMQTNTVKLSRLWFEMLGYSDNELPHHFDTFKDNVHPDDISRVYETLQDYLSGKIASYMIELRMRCKDESYKWILTRGTVMKWDNRGSPLRMIGIHSDITERKNAELALKENQEKLSGLFSLSPLGIALTDMSGRYLEFNEAFRDICGYSADELRKLDYWTITPSEYEPQEHEQLDLLRRFGRYGPFEKVYRKKNGQLVPIRLNGIMVQDKDGNPQIWSIVEDITDSKQAEQILIAAREEADRANKAKSEFLSSMSHELRTPMNAILGFSQLMEIDNDLSHEHKDNVQEILKAGHHLLNLINEVLDLAKVESGHIDLSIEPVEVRPVLEECLSLVENLASRRDIHITISGQKLGTVLADRTRLKQSILNLLSNAIKYNRENGQVNIHLQQEEADHLKIQVTDTGRGIAPDYMEKLFQPFNRLHAEYSGIEGTGIGLTITQRIVEMMGGKIGVESTVGAGSTFWIELPCQSKAESIQQSDDKGALTNEFLSIESQPTTGFNVIYIEDNPSNIRLMEQIFSKRQGIKLISAHTPELGIQLAFKHQPDLILLDINMPGMDGYQVLEILKLDNRTCDIPVVALTANAMPRDIKYGIERGFADYITKPINISHFHAVIDRILAREQISG